MSLLRRAIVVTSAERYATAAVNLISTAILARILTPGEFGISVLGGAVFAVLGIAREFGCSSYIIQHESLTKERTQVAFTVMLFLTLLLTGIILAIAPGIAKFYATPELRAFLQVSLLAFFLGPFVTTVFALMKREMQFGTMAAINLCALLVNTVVTVGLVMLGFSFMSFAWANAVSGVLALVLALYVRPDFSLFVPTLREWRSVLSFARYDAPATMLIYLGMALPSLVLGRVVNIDALGLYQRAARLCEMPKNILLRGLAVSILPTLAQRRREGSSLKSDYLNGVAFVTAVQWPTLLMLILLAHPLVLILFGNQWIGAIPLVRIMASALLLNFSVSLTYSTLVVAGAVRHALLLQLIVVPVSAGALYFAGQYGIDAAAWSMLPVVGLEVFSSVILVRQHLHFSWSELAGATSKSSRHYSPYCAWSRAGNSRFGASPGLFHHRSWRCCFVGRYGLVRRPLVIQSCAFPRGRLGAGSNSPCLWFAAPPTGRVSHATSSSWRTIDASSVSVNLMRLSLRSQSRDPQVRCSTGQMGSCLSRALVVNEYQFG